MTVDFGDVLLTVQALNRVGGGMTIVAEVRNVGAQWYRSEVDIVAPLGPLDLPNALRMLGDELARNMGA